MPALSVTSVKWRRGRPSVPRVVPEQPCTGGLAGREGEARLAGRLALVEHRALEQQHVEVTVAVVVQEGPAGAHDLGHEVLAARAREVAEAQAGFFGDVAKEPQVRAARGQGHDQAERPEADRESDSRRGHRHRGGAASRERRSRAIVAASSVWPRAAAFSCASLPYRRPLSRSPARTQAAASA